jgi:hypothetical protein
MKDFGVFVSDRGILNCVLVGVFNGPGVVLLFVVE